MKCPGRSCGHSSSDSSCKRSASIGLPQRGNTAERVYRIEAAHNPEVAGSNPAPATAKGAERCLWLFLEELLDPGVEVEIDSCDPASGYAYDTWRQSCSDPAAGYLNRVEAGPQPDRVPARLRCLHLGDRRAVTFELEKDSRRRRVTGLVGGTDRLRRPLHHQSAETRDASSSSDCPGGGQHRNQGDQADSYTTHAPKVP